MPETFLFTLINYVRMRPLYPISLLLEKASALLCERIKQQSVHFRTSEQKQCCHFLQALKIFYHHLSYSVVCSVRFRFLNVARYSAD